MTIPHRFLTGSVAIERRTATDAYSGNTYAAAVTVPARWFDEVRVVRSHDAREVVSTAHVSVTAPVAVGDRVTPASGGRAREVVAVRRNESTRGAFSHYVGYLA
jgi:hypothetical protein